MRVSGRQLTCPAAACQLRRETATQGTTVGVGIGDPAVSHMRPREGRKVVEVGERRAMANETWRTWAVALYVTSERRIRNMVVY